MGDSDLGEIPRLKDVQYGELLEANSTRLLSSSLDTHLRFGPFNCSILGRAILGNCLSVFLTAYAVISRHEAQST